MSGWGAPAGPDTGQWGMRLGLGFQTPAVTCGVTALEEDLGGWGLLQPKGEGNFPLVHIWDTASFLKGRFMPLSLPTGGALVTHFSLMGDPFLSRCGVSVHFPHIWYTLPSI